MYYNAIIGECLIQSQVLNTTGFDDPTKSKSFIFYAYYFTDTLSSNEDSSCFIMD